MAIDKDISQYETAELERYAAVYENIKQIAGQITLPNTQHVASINSLQEIADLQQDPLSDQQRLLEIATAVNTNIPFFNQAEGIATVADQASTFLNGNDLLRSDNPGIRDSYINQFDCKLPTCVVEAIVKAKLAGASVDLTQRKGSPHVGLVITLNGSQYYLDYKSRIIDDAGNNESYPSVRKLRPGEYANSKKELMIYNISKPEDLLAIDQTYLAVRATEDKSRETAKQQANNEPLKYHLPKQPDEPLEERVKADTGHYP